MNDRPKRRTENLLRGRVSIPHARYFITLCTKGRKSGLTAPIIAEAIRNTWRRQHRDNDYVLHCATVMPDHLHWLCTLGERLTLSRIISKFKSLTPIQWDWQRNYYDHRLRADDSREPFSRYVFLNPYRKGLLRHDEEWPWWTLNRNEKPEFIEHLNKNRFPPPEWIDQGMNLKELIDQDMTGEDSHQM